MRSKFFFSSFLSLLIAFSSAALISPSTHAQSTNGLITSDTTWTKSGSPINLNSPVAVDHGVTLTVEPGVTVNLNGYYIRVNGTLNSKGTSTDKITFNGGQITFTNICNGWNEQTQSGCIIQNAVLNQVIFSTSNPIKIDSSTITGDTSVTSASIISNCNVNGDINSLMSTITNNNVKGDIIVGSVTPGGFTTAEEASKVSGNTVEGEIFSGSPKGTPEIFDNYVIGGGIGCVGYGLIHNNYVHNSDVGISLSSTRVFGGYLACFATVENNLIIDNDRGIAISLSSMDGPGGMAPTIQKNTIARNSIGISLMEMNYAATPTIQNNNLMDNTQYNFYLASSNNVDVSHNWWGTIDTAAIDQSIYDFNENFDYGTVTYEPILTSPNPDAPSLTAPTITSTPAPTDNPTPSPSVPELPTAAILVFAVAATTLTATTLTKKTKFTFKIKK